MAAGFSSIIKKSVIFKLIRASNCMTIFPLAQLTPDTCFYAGSEDEVNVL